MKERIIIFGASNGGRNAFEFLSKNNTVIAFCDNDFNKQGGILHGIKVVSPAVALGLEFDRVYICSYFKPEIRKQLQFDMQLPSSKISEVNDYILEFGESAFPTRLIVVTCLAGFFSIGYFLL